MKNLIVIAITLFASILTSEEGRPNLNVSINGPYIDHSVDPPNGSTTDVEALVDVRKVIIIKVASTSGLELADVSRSKRWFSKSYGHLLKTKNITDDIQVTFDRTKGVIVKFWRNDQWVKSDYWSGVLELHQPMKGKLNTLTFTVKFK